MTTFNAKCPVCDGPVHITGFSVRQCDIPIKESGWAVMATIRNTDGTEEFTCPKCLVSVPAMYVYKEMSSKEAVSFMEKWSGNVFSIHNRKPLPPPERMEDEAKKIEDAADKEHEEEDRLEEAVATAKSDETVQV